MFEHRIGKGYGYDQSENNVREHLQELLAWFPSGTAEGERAILEKIFVYVKEFQQIISPPAGSPYLLIGNKGTGKSAILDFGVRILNYQKIPAVLLRPSDIDSDDVPDEAPMGRLTKVFYEKLLSAVAAKIVEDQSGFLTGDIALLYNEAIRSGLKSPDLIGRIARSLSQLSKPATRIDFAKVFPELNPSTRQEIEQATARSLEGQRFYVFIDDTDQVASPGKPGHLNRIWGLILAVRELSSKFSEIRSVITLRTEIWQRLKHEASGQRDQTDHFASLCVELKSDNEQLRRIIERRLSFAATACGSRSDIYQTFFSGSTARAPDSEEPRSWLDLIVVRSRQRPRDAVQLVSALAKFALSKKHTKIEESDFQAVMPNFSESRAKLFAQEVELECPRAFDILLTFSNASYEFGGFRMNSEQTLNHLRRIPSQFGIVLYGKSIRPNVEGDIFDLWRFLYSSNILNGRISDSTQKDGYRHLDSEEDLNLVSKARWNTMQSMLWEVNPAFRDFLILKQKAKQASTGLPTRTRKPRTRRS